MANTWIFTIIAGINGAGKSSLRDHVSNLGEVIDTDKIHRELFFNLPHKKTQSEAFREALRLQKFFIDNLVSFTQETTLSGRSIFKVVKDAKEKGFKIILLFVGIEGVELAKHRVALRVAKGGHHIPDEDVNRRYDRTLSNLPVLLKLCDQAFIFDNTNKHTIIATFSDEKLEFKIESLPNWFSQSFGMAKLQARVAEAAATDSNIRNNQ